MGVRFSRQAKEEESRKRVGATIGRTKDRCTRGDPVDLPLGEKEKDGEGERKGKEDGIKIEKGRKKREEEKRNGQKRRK